MSDGDASPDHPEPPPALRAMLAEASWRAETIGMSGAGVWRIEAPGRAPRYLKRAVGPRMRELHEERERLDWLRDRLPIPAVEGWAEDGDGAWLLLSAAPGVMAQDANALCGVPTLVRALGEGLRRIHDVPIAACPFVMRLGVRLARATWNIAAGLVDEPDVRAIHGASSVDLLHRLEATRPPEPTEDLVFVHGDYCLPNILIASEGSLSPRVAGLLDWGRAGVSDRYQDLAIGARSLRHNLGSGWESTFFEAYGLADPDPVRMAYYEALDELF
jgi:aminoglycoside phosphotransferase